LLGLFLEMGSHKVFAQTVLELLSSQVARITGVSHWCLARSHF
jgi:hypothetical protein